MLYDVCTYDYSKISSAELCPVRQGRKRKREENNAVRSKNLVTCFDIETSKKVYKTEYDKYSRKEVPRYQSWLYIWQHAIEDDVIIGRTWEEYETHLDRINEQLAEDEKLVIYVHNLSYEFQFLSGIFHYDNDEVFAIDRRKIAKVNHGKIEYRCSYILSNLSLDVWADKMKVKHRKKVGDLDYNVERYPWTVLSDTELGYCVHDVIAVVECVHTALDVEGDTLDTIPLTSTGYVRRDCRRAMHQWSRFNLDELKPDLDLWRILREAFRGGDTHANRYYAGMILDDVKSVDRSSSYPDVMCNELFPMTRFQREKCPSIDMLNYLINKRKKACVFKVIFRNIRLRDRMNGFPYLSIAKCKQLLHCVDNEGKRDETRPLNDNGRVLQAALCSTTLTDIDWKIVCAEYEWDDVIISDIYHARYGYLPAELRGVVQDYYRRKTALKNVEGQEVLYFLSKTKINACYGMTAQNPVKQPLLFDDESEELWSIGKEDEGGLLDNYNAKAFLVYQWGVWVTAHARYQLREMLWAAGYKAVYCDTDSVKHVGEVDFSAYNKERQGKSAASMSFASDKFGKCHYMGVAETDGEYARFITLGAKKYVYEDKKGLHITIAGVNKKKGAAELGKLENFEEGFTFHDAGGAELTYNDHPEIEFLNVDGRKLPITRNVVITDSTYTLGLDAAYRDVLFRSRYFLQEIDRKY